MVESLQLTLQGMAYGGEAFGRDAEGRMIFVPFALPGERVSVELVKSHRRWARGRLERVLEPAPERIHAPRCRHFRHCGGCHYQHMPYEAQLKAKADIVRDQLRRIGGFENPPVEATVPSPSPWNYRNNLRFSLTLAGELGFVTADGADIFAVEECHLPEQALAELWPQLDLDAIPGLKQVSVRVGVEGERMIVLHAERDPEVELSIDLPASVVWQGPGGVAVLAGSDHFVIEALGRPFRVSAWSFFQVHTNLVEELVKRTVEAVHLQPGDVVFDLYAGVGTFSASLAERQAQVIAIEASPSACADFEVNLDEFETVSLYQAPVELGLPAIEDHPDAVIVDPPRSGLGKLVTSALLDRAPPQLVYVSCDPATLARDGRHLEEGGYRLESVTPIDLFPQTYHIETISVWRR